MSKKLAALSTIQPVLLDIREHLVRANDEQMSEIGDYPSFGWLSHGSGTIFTDDRLRISIASRMISHDFGKKAHSDWLDVHGPSYCLDGLGYECDFPFQCMAQAVIDLLELPGNTTILEAESGLLGRTDAALTAEQIALYRAIRMRILEACVSIVKHEAGTDVPAVRAVLSEIG